MTHTFCGSPLDRGAERRDDREWLAARLRDPSTFVIAFSEGRPLVADGKLVRLPSGAVIPPLFLGLWDDRAVFAIETSEQQVVDGQWSMVDPNHQPSPINHPVEFMELRPVALTLPAEEAAIVAAAKSLFDWHRRHGFCAVCGNATNIVSAGWKRLCPKCSAEHFPRVDPVVIMLPLFGDRCLVGRNPAWPRGRMAALAGFIEPGESAEEACAREMKEEAGLIATRITYDSSQPWPFPSSLMLGLYAEVASDEVKLDPSELEEVRWLTREEAQAVLEGRHPELLRPNAYAIGHDLLAGWAFGSSGPRTGR